MILIGEEGMVVVPPEGAKTLELWVRWGYVAEIESGVLFEITDLGRLFLTAVRRGDGPIRAD